MKNIALARKVMERIREEPLRHDQSEWVNVPAKGRLANPVTVSDMDNCGSVACFAGWTCLLAGDTLRNHTGFVVEDNGGDIIPMHAMNRARQLLGLSCQEADLLFFCDDSYLDEKVYQIFGERL